MTLTAEMVAQVHALVPGDPGVLTESLEGLLTASVEAVPSCLGVSLTVHDHGEPHRLTVLARGAASRPVLSSLQLRLPGQASTGAVLALYAGRARALDRAAAEFLVLLDLDPRRASLDQDLVLPDVRTHADDFGQALADGSAVARALGVLLDRDGLLPAAGRGELERLATRGGTSLPGAARGVLTSVRHES